MAKVSKIEQAGLVAETLRRAASGESAASVQKWLATEGCQIGLTPLKVFVRRRHGGRWRPVSKKAKVQSQVEQLIAAPLVEVVKPLPAECPEVSEIRRVALDRVERGVATPGDAKTLEVALKAAIAERMIKQGSA